MEEPVVDRVRNQLIAMIDRALGDDPKSALIASRELKDEIEWLTERSVAATRGPRVVAHQPATRHQPAVGTRTVQGRSSPTAAARRCEQSLSP
jgi:hypothetical protein